MVYSVCLCAHMYTCAYVELCVCVFASADICPVMVRDDWATTQL